MINRKSVKGWIVVVINAIVIVIIINKFVLFKIIVPSQSMEPTIKAGDQIIATIVYKKGDLKRGDIVVFYSKEFNELLLKRVIGLPGETIDIKETGTVYIDGKKINEPYVLYSESHSGKFKVPENHYFFMGDNRADSIDSRRWECPYIDSKDIKGKARFIIYPFNRIGKPIVNQISGKDSLFFETQII